MADFKARQRVALHNGTNEFGFANTAPVFIKLTDATNDLGLVVIDSAFGATPVAIPIAGKYEATPTTYTDGDAVPLLLDVNGRMQVAISSLADASNIFVDDSAFTVTSSKVAAIGAMADETSPDSVTEGDIGIPRMTLDRKILTRVVGATDANRLDIDANGAALAILQANSGVDIGDVTINNGAGAAAVNIQDGGNTITVDASDLDIRDLTHVSDSVKIGDGTDFWAIDGSGFGQVDIAAQSLTAIKVSKDANANTELNPIYVQVVSGVISGDEKHIYATATPASDATSNLDYTVTTAKTFLLKSVVVASSGATKTIVSVGPVSSLVTKVVLFTSGAKPTEQIFFDPPIEVPDTSTGTIRVAVRNDENQSMDVYATIEGNEI